MHSPLLNRAIATSELCREALREMEKWKRVYEQQDVALAQIIKELSDKDFETYCSIDPQRG